MTRLTAASRLTLSALALVAGCSIGAAETPHATTRKVRKSQPASPARAAPDMTATIPLPARTADQDETLPARFELPQAPRPRMRACGERWQAIKLAGQAADQTWRDFATKCLAQSDAKPPR